ncbi:DNA recombination protein RmuC [Xanthomonas hortorum]|uniref:DNA recombination protein RmuC n=1 Tax=Xanthomonas hortorum pv. pelargonii TaxID=453602 RepID=A0A6V7FA14_9XANT|nr:DNA recombination protein RmuC [Xanthomonas hortorum]MCE4355019.1 DNA recombination protein RmuC [Xanthomonas hortorum pv. pelargonii]MCM5522933.1 DNA recombination protein RmuC [Xanthomonas hortorum pv. pelargonii]MCM5535148.1 DNA recombination protein RmuC [Xanthomonas hortorum pv. pelargonii]MCM5539277.1 DNA recombination protein RmuC [Xanthomonas hortorum pv. pelargonii]MCM5543427.1 DNA recombination protein RmuC [Xanthomonas hortorum pv. pelargonii]
MSSESLILLGLLVVVLVLQLLALLRRPSTSGLELALRAEQRDGRGELREQLEGLARQQDGRLETFARNLTELSTRTDQRLDLLRDALGEDARKAREESGLAQQRTGELLTLRLTELRTQLEGFGQQQETRIQVFGQQLTELIARTDTHMATLREALAEDARKGRQEAGESQQRFTEALSQRLNELTQRNELRIGEMRATLEQQLANLQNDNASKLEQMRATVDEKLQTTLNTRLDASFKIVSERLEQVQRGLGEMQQLATGVGDLKRVLTNVKNRGGWGEVQLENILEQTLTAEQYSRSVRVRPDTSEAVDFAVRLPGRGHEDTPVWLPIDSKFPREDYERLLDAQEAGDIEQIRLLGNQLERAIRIQAKSISDKYICPPHTTDFAVMFLPTEGLYAETIRRPGLVDVLQREHRVVIAGPTTFTALLNSLQMGFRTLAIEKRSSEVWGLLGAVKSEFGKFAGILEKAERQINTVGKTLGDAGRKTRTIERRLRGVETLSNEHSQALLDDAGSDDAGSSSEDDNNDEQE